MSIAIHEARFTSQCGEDRWMAEHWDSLGLPDVGFFVEFGAADGVSSSNTYWLEKSKGWRGLLIEADLRHDTTDIIRSRPKSQLLIAAIGPAGRASFGYDDHDPCLSGIRREATKRVDVDCLPLSTVLASFDIPHVDLISIDTEGTELEAWKTLDLTRWRPRIAIIEFFSWGISESHEETVRVLREDGYELLHTTKYNCIFRDAA